MPALSSLADGDVAEINWGKYILSSKLMTSNMMFSVWKQVPGRQSAKIYIRRNKATC